MRFDKAKFSVFVKTCALFFPLGWYTLAGPGSLRVFLVWSIFLFFEIGRARLLSTVLRAWPIPLMVSFYLLGRFIAPELDIEAQTYGPPEAVATICYGIPAGFCLGLWSRKEAGSVLLAFVIFASTLVIAANGLIQVVGSDNIIKETGNEFFRVNPDSGFVFLGIFKPYNVVIGIVFITVFAIGALPLLLLPGWKLHKTLSVMAAIAGVYANILVATRTALLAGALSFACILVMFSLKGAIKKSRMIWMLLVCAASGIIVLNRLDLSNIYAPLAERLSQLAGDERFDIWREAIKLLWKNPVGGGINDLTTHQWAHDLFLDFGLTYGWIGMGAMLALYGFIFYSALKAIQRTDILTLPIGVVVLSVFLACFFIAITEPPNPALIAFSYLTCCYCLSIEDEATKACSKSQSGISISADRRVKPIKVTNKRIRRSLTE